MKLFIETFTEQFATFGLLRASTKAQLKEREEKFVAGLKVRRDPLRTHNSHYSCALLPVTACESSSACVQCGRSFAHPQHARGGRVLAWAADTCRT